MAWAPSIQSTGPRPFQLSDSSVWEELTRNTSHRPSSPGRCATMRRWRIVKKRFAHGAGRCWTDWTLPAATSSNTGLHKRANVRRATP